MHRFSELQVLGDFRGTLRLGAELRAFNGLIIFPVDQNLLLALFVQLLRFLELLDQLRAICGTDVLRGYFQQGLLDFVVRDGKAVLQFLYRSIGLDRLRRKVFAPDR